MQRFLKQLQREIRTTFLFVTHDQEEAVTIADRICVMNQRPDRADRLAAGSLLPAGQRVRRPLLRRQQPHRRRRLAAVVDGCRLVNAPSAAFRCAADGVVDAAGARHAASCWSAPRRSPSAIPPGTANRLRVRVEEASFVGPVSQVRVRALAAARRDADGEAAEPRLGLAGRASAARRRSAGASANVTWSRHSAGPRAVERGGAVRDRTGSRRRRSPMRCPPSSSCCRSASF